MTVDVDSLPITQALCMEVLAGRYRLGETLWTFDARCGTALNALERHGLVTTMHGILERTVRASLTAAGREAVLSPTYVSPERLAGRLEGYDDGVRDADRIQRMHLRDVVPPGPWRIGQHYGVHVYEGERPVGTFHTPEDAARAVEAVNRAAPRELRPAPHRTPYQEDQ